MRAPTATESLIEMLSDLVLLVRRDGVLLEHIGGQGLADLAITVGAVGKRLDRMWPDRVATLVTQLVRRAIADRSAAEGRIGFNGVAKPLAAPDFEERFIDAPAQELAHGAG